MKRFLEAIGQFFAMIGIFLFALVMTILFWWPVLAIGLIVTFGVFFISTTASIVVASLIGFLFLLVFLLKLFD